MKKTIIFIVGLMCLGLMATPVFAQRVDAQGAIGGSIPGRPGWFKFERNVIISYGSIRIHSDYAEVNNATNDFEARGNLRIRLQNGGIITGKTLRNDPRNNVMIVDQDVIFTDQDSTKLFTDRMIYNRQTEVSTYHTGGKIITADSTVLTSRIGHIHSKTNAFHGKTDVVIESPDYLIHTDTMQMIGDVIYFFSATHVWSDSNYLYCEKGWYNSKEKIASLTDNAFIQTPDNKLFADSIYYEMDTDFGEAFNNVTAIDSANDIIIHSDFALSNRQQGDAWFTKNAVAIVISDGDSLYLRGDTLRIAYDTSTNEVIHMLAYYDVLFFRHDMQGASDSMAYVMVDSMLTMFGNPIVWSHNDQLTGDTIQILMTDNNSRPQRMYLQNKAFITSKGYHEGHFNQVKGWKIIGFFNDSAELETIRVFENVETVYFVTDDADSSLIGILKVNANEMEITLEEQVVISINYLDPEDGSMFPDAELPLEDRYLRGFLWQVNRRPMSKFDIWPDAPRSLFEELQLLQQREFD